MRSDEDRWCAWPVGDLQGVEGAIACGHYAPNTRVAPDGRKWPVCDEHTTEAENRTIKAAFPSITDDELADIDKRTAAINQALNRGIE